MGESREELRGVREKMIWGRENSKNMMVSTDSAGHFAHFQVQGRTAAPHAVTEPMHAVKFLFIATFHWGLRITAHSCVVVGVCFMQDQPDKTAITWFQCPCTQWHGQVTFHFSQLGKIATLSQCAPFEISQTQNLCCQMHLQ